MKRRCARPAPARGVALLVVLWALTLLAILLGGYAMVARTEGRQARYQFAQTQAHYAAEAGLMRAIYALQDVNLKQRWVSDGRTYPFAFDGSRVQVSMVDEGGKVDLNASSPEVLKGLFKAAGLVDAAAQKLAANVVDWRNFVPDGATSAAAMAGANAGSQPRHAPFASVEEVQQVQGMTATLYARIAPDITIWSGRDAPDPATAPPLALAAIPGMTPAEATRLMAARMNPAAMAGLAAAGGVTHSIRSEAVLADGTRAVLGATIRLQGFRSGTQPYAVLRWQEGEGQ